MEYIVQIFSGGFHNRLYEAEDVCERLSEITKKIKIKTVIIGWNTDTGFYKKVGAYLKEKGMEMYLWLPVFSEIGQFSEADSLVDLWGRKTEKYELQDGESFEFFCPSSEKNRNLLFSIFETYFADCGFDGVFLDKIRTQSYVSKASDVMGCCCKICREFFEKENVDIKRLGEEIEKEGFAKALVPADFDKSKGFLFKNPLAERFFLTKCKLYSKEIGKTAKRFREMGYKIGMDIYAPVLARLVGQDYRELTVLADFIKPMMYRRTKAPAGIGFEYEKLKAALSEEFEKVLGEEKTLNPVSEELLQAQLQIEDRASMEKVFPGIEVNYREDIAPTDTEYIKNSLRAVKAAGCRGAVLSWDIMLAPQAHIEAAALVQEERTKGGRHGKNP